MSLGLKHCLKQEIGPTMGQEKAKWLFKKKAWDFEHIPQAIWAINGLREKSRQMAEMSLGF
jgi:hypothetical protein